MPINEETRLQILKQYELLDTADEVAYDDLVVLAASICKTPMASICLIDEYRQWFKSTVGFNIRQTDRTLSFCAHTILKPSQVMVVPDTTQDFRFSDNDMVVGGPQVRFYAGVALLSPEGVPLGALSVMDCESRVLSDEQLNLLKGIARQVEAQFELRRSKIQLQYKQLELENAQKAASDAAGVKKVFLANINNELRTPISGIMGLSSLLGSTSDSKQHSQYVDSIEKSASSLLHVVSNILEFSKNEVGDTIGRLEQVDTYNLVEEVLAMMQPVAMAKDLRMFVEFDEKLNRKLVGDRLRIQNVLTNLVGNAIKFTKSGSVAIKVRQVGERFDGPLVRFEVKDTGIGIPRNMQSRIFEEFTQVEQGPERNYGGTGLGLTISRQLAKGMRTEIKVSSELGEGSTFWFDLEMPFDSGFDTLIQQAPEVMKDESRRFRILVVDDNDFHSMILGSLLEKLDCDVEVVESGEAIVGMLGRRVFDLVFLDAHMPDDVAFAYAKSIRRMPYPTCNVPIVAMSPSVSNEDEATYVSVGINDIVIKPVSERAVFHTVSKWCSRKETRATA